MICWETPRQICFLNDCNLTTKSFLASFKFSSKYKSVSVITDDGWIVSFPYKAGMVLLHTKLFIYYYFWYLFDLLDDILVVINIQYVWF